MGILGELSHIHGPRKANLFSQCSSGHRVAILTWLVSNGCPTGLSLEVDGDVGDGRSQIRNLTVSYRFWPKKHRGFLPSFLPSFLFLERKRKRRKNARSYLPFPFPFLFLLSFHAPRGNILFSLLSFFFLSFKRVVSTRDSVHDEIDCRFVPSSSKIRRGERKWRGKRYRGQDSSLWSGEFGNRREG